MCLAACLQTNPPRQRDPGFEAVVKQTARELGLEPDEEFVHNVVALRWACPCPRGSRVVQGRRRLMLRVNYSTVQVAQR